MDLLLSLEFRWREFFIVFSFKLRLMSLNNKSPSPAIEKGWKAEEVEVYIAFGG
jgi:hypothetical protein